LGNPIRDSPSYGNGYKRRGRAEGKSVAENDGGIANGIEDEYVAGTVAVLPWHSAMRGKQTILLDQ